MSVLELQTKRSALIEYLTTLEDENILIKIEEIINYLKNNKSQEIKLSNEDLIKRANISNYEILNGLVIAQNDLELLSANW